MGRHFRILTIWRVDKMEVNIFKVDSLAFCNLEPGKITQYLSLGASE
jgi:hypothetical protein